MQVQSPELKAIEQPERFCSCCKVDKLITIQYFDRRGPPQTHAGMGQKSLKVADNLQKSYVGVLGLVLKSEQKWHISALNHRKKEEPQESSTKI
jgi:hypothetical protein